jgi:hypothetical protein
MAFEYQKHDAEARGAKLQAYAWKWVGPSEIVQNWWVMIWPMS